MVIAGLVLAAGEGTRFGGKKVLAELGGEPLVRHVVRRLMEAGVAPIVVVASGDLDAMRKALVMTEARVVENPSPRDGLSSSLRYGLDGLPEAIDAFFVALGDQPRIDPALIRQLASVWTTSNAAAVVPAYRQERGNPVLFDATMRRRLRELTGDNGARDLLVSMGDRVVQVPVEQDAPQDVDTRDDLRALDA